MCALISGADDAKEICAYSLNPDDPPAHFSDAKAARAIGAGASAMGRELFGVQKPTAHQPQQQQYVPPQQQPATNPVRCFGLRVEGLGFRVYG